MGAPLGIKAFVPHDTLLRALRNAKDREELAHAFMLRPTEQDTGLSVNFDQTPSECQQGFSCTYGVARLTVQNVAEAATGANIALNANFVLQVIADEPHHANITGVPYKETNPLGAERVASELAKLAVLVSTEKVDNRNH
jgi:hypothetical protein